MDGDRDPFQGNDWAVASETSTRAESSALENQHRRRLRYRLIEYYWTQIKAHPLSKSFRCASNLCRYMPVVLAFLSRCTSKGPLRELVSTRPEILQMVCRPYLAVSWDVPTRFARIVDHCETVTEIGGVLDFPPDAIIDLTTLAPIDPRYRLTLDQARWLFSEGQLVLSLWDGIDRIFSLQFCLSSRESKRIAYIGALQGRPQKDGEPDILDRYRVFTKAAAGMRPRDFVIETFKTICRILDVTEIRAVSNLNQPARQTSSVIELSYDEIWQERGGIDDGNGFFILPVIANRRFNEEIPAKKKASYAKRYAMLDVLEAELAATFNSDLVADNPESTRTH
jgi:uncharacterized protein VirK/YbjX